MEPKPIKKSSKSLTFKKGEREALEKEFLRAFMIMYDKGLVKQGKGVANAKKVGGKNIGIQPTGTVGES